MTLTAHHRRYCNGERDARAVEAKRRYERDRRGWAWSIADYEDVDLDRDLWTFHVGGTLALTTDPALALAMAEALAR